jgi:hypothetical protein
VGKKGRGGKVVPVVCGRTMTSFDRGRCEVRVRGRARGNIMLVTWRNVSDTEVSIPVSYTLIGGDWVQAGCVQGA